MTECVSLAVLLGRRHFREMMVLLIIFALVGAFSCFALMFLPRHDVLSRFIVNSLVGWAFLAGLWGILLLDFYRLTEVTGPVGAYEGWLLRTPIASWKLAIVPILAKGLWLAMLVAAVKLLSLTWAAGSVPWNTCFSIVLAGSAVGAGISATLWRPFRHDITRAILVIVVFFFGYIMTMIFLNAIVRVEYQSYQTIAHFFVGVVFLSATMLGVRGIELSRVNGAGLLPGHQLFGRPGKREEKSASGAERSAIHEDRDFEVGSDSRCFASAAAAMAYHDSTRAWRRIGRSGTLVFFAVVVAMAALPIPNTGVAFFLMPVLVWVFGNVASSVFTEGTSWKQQSSLPEYLIAAPVSVRKITFTRMSMAALACFVTSLAVLCLSMITMVTRQWIMSRWSESSEFDPWQAIGMGPENWHPLGATAFALAWLVVTLISAIGMLWIQFSGSNRLGTLVAFVWVGGVFLVLTSALIWFAQQSDWNSALSVWNACQRWLPIGMAVLLALKIFGMARAAMSVIGSDDVTKGEFAGGLILWAVACLLVSALVVFALFDRGIELDTVQRIQAMVGTFILMPGIGILLAPLMVRRNLHR
ncbi:MAG: hypothetical protein AAF989_08000 [Planctomycetota bacterium]